MLKHGGNLRQASVSYGIPLDDWLDLSTGINPQGWPVPEIPAECWRCLPQENDGLEEAARQYYGAGHLLPVAGSQAAIQLLPLLRPCGDVGMSTPAYTEHEYNWSRYGHAIHYVTEDIEARLEHLDVLIIINPNNPTGQAYSVEQLLDWHGRLAEHGGWLVVDEAFIDSTPEYSLAAYSDRPGLIVLRSLGKFFGLAGLRCGFVLADLVILEPLRELLGPWSVSGPAREVARLALLDALWQDRSRRHLRAQGERLQQLLSYYNLTPTGGTSLFQWLQHPRAREIHEALARHGIWTRLFEHPSSLRLGLPGTEEQWRHLQTALQTILQDITQRDGNDDKAVLKK